MSIFSVFTLLNSCNKNEIRPLIFLSTENGLSKITERLGITAITELVNSHNSNIYKINSKLKLINNISLNLNETNLTILKEKNNYHVSLSSKSNNFIRFVLDDNTKSLYIEKNNKRIDLEQITKNSDMTYLSIAMILFNDIINTKENYNLKNLSEQKKIDKQQINSKELFKNKKIGVVDESEYGGCERTIVSIRNTESRAISHVNSATDDFIKENKDCKRIYGVDTGCLWGGYVCIASQSIKCTGGGCDIDFGALEE